MKFNKTKYKNDPRNLVSIDYHHTYVLTTCKLHTVHYVSTNLLQYCSW